MRPWPHLRVQKYELPAIWPNVFVKKYNKIQWQRLAKDGFPLKAQYFTAQEKSERFFRLFSTGGLQTYAKTHTAHGKTERFCEKTAQEHKEDKRMKEDEGQRRWGSI